jgi:hypothetical protein
MVVVMVLLRPSLLPEHFHPDYADRKTLCQTTMRPGPRKPRQQ